MMIELLGLLAIPVLMLYGCAWAVGGPGLANSFAKKSSRLVLRLIGKAVSLTGEGITWIGKKIPRLLS